MNGAIIRVRQLHTCSVFFNQKPNNLKGKKHSSQLWLRRQITDPYVEKTRLENYRCRSAFKLLEINSKYTIFAPGQIVIDCGAAPGSWSQVAVKLTNSDGKISDQPKGSVFSIDRQPFTHVSGAQILGNMDFTLPESQEQLRQLMNGKLANIVMSDMAPNATGEKEMDHDKIISLSYAALKFALTVLVPDGVFLTKIWDGGKTLQLKNDLLKFYKYLKIVRPQSTRVESSEMFLLAKGFKGLKSKQ